VNSLEFESGRPSDKPYDVSTAEALKHAEVVNRFNRSVIQVKQLTTMFLATIVKAKANKKLPYGLLYLSKVLFNALKKKFPHHQDKVFKFCLRLFSSLAMMYFLGLLQSCWQSYLLSLHQLCYCGARCFWDRRQGIFGRQWWSKPRSGDFFI